METPKNSRVLGATRNPTPRLSERKKNLFCSQKNIENDLMDGIEPIGLTESRLMSRRRTPKSKRLFICQEPSNSISFFRDDALKSDDHMQGSPSQICSFRLDPKIGSNDNIPENANSIENCKENLPVSLETEEHLQRLFDTSMKLSGCKQKGETNTLLTTHDTDESTSCDESNSNMIEEGKKREIEKSGAMGLSPKRKVARVETGSILAVPISISTRSFYSTTNTSPVVKSTIPNSRFPIISPKSRRQITRRPCNINKGVTHKIRKKSKNTTAFTKNQRTTIDIDHILNNVRSEKLKNLITSKRQEKLQIEKLDQIYKNNQNPIEMARPLSSISADNKYNNNNNEKNCNANMETVKESNDLEFSDIECDDYLEEDFEDKSSINQVLDETFNVQKKSDASAINRKFFKSGRSTTTRKEVKITENIKALVCNGKISLLQEKKPQRRKIKLKNSLNEFSDEQATVDEILKNLDDTAFGDMTVNNNENVEVTPTYTDYNLLSNRVIENTREKTYNEFLNRIPYNTSNPELIQQQKLLLDFLINNNICTEENFTIFIADPDNHKEEASRIVDQVIVVVNEQSGFRQRIPFNTNDPLIIQQQNNFLDFLIEHNICTEENFDIFIANYNNRCDEAEAIVHNTLSQIQSDPISNSNVFADNYIVDSQKPAENYMEEEIGNQNQYSINTINNINGYSLQKLSDGNSPTETLSEKPKKLFSIFSKPHFQPFQQKSTRKTVRTWTGGHGANQYQIDAGQVNFGAQQCKHCGLVYTVHEPEEEKLHKEYHASIHVLRFKGWIDEDIVAIYPEWGPDGRIIRISDSSHTKRKERLMDVLKLVDKELGFSSYIFPKSYMAYFAVRKYQIVGLCLVQPLQKANRYICVNGVDCCTEEEFEAKCGVSRIWVSPLHRRLHIGSKLIKAVQFNTIFGEEIALDKLAFSAPTENGKKFARSVTKMENFLVYQ